MRVLALLILELTKLLGSLLEIYTYVVLIAVLLSWVNPDPNNPIVRLLRSITEPVFYRARRLLPTVLLRTGIDFSPLVVLLAIALLRNVLLRVIFEWAAGVRIRL